MIVEVHDKVHDNMEFPAWIWGSIMIMILFLKNIAQNPQKLQFEYKWNEKMYTF